jgi:hypothetical protein
MRKHKTRILIVGIIMQEFIIKREIDKNNNNEIIIANELGQNNNDETSYDG